MSSDVSGERSATGRLCSTQRVRGIVVSYYQSIFSYFRYFLFAFSAYCVVFLLLSVVIVAVPRNKMYDDDLTDWFSHWTSERLWCGAEHKTERRNAAVFDGRKMQRGCSTAATRSRHLRHVTWNTSVLAQSS